MTGTVVHLWNIFDHSCQMIACQQYFHIVVKRWSGLIVSIKRRALSPISLESFYPKLEILFVKNVFFEIRIQMSQLRFSSLLFQIVFPYQIQCFTLLQKIQFESYCHPSMFQVDVHCTYQSLSQNFLYGGKGFFKIRQSNIIDNRTALSL